MKVVLAYSGGLDTSIILRWLQETYDAEVITFTADLGQGEEVEPARAKALEMGVPAENIHIEDVREEFVRDFVYPMFPGQHDLRGRVPARHVDRPSPLIAKRLVEIAAEHGADAISHGATGKGNDQVRFELGAYALSPEIKVIAPWREWELGGRETLMEYAREHDIPIEMKRGKKSPFSMDANLLHISFEGGPLEDPFTEPPSEMWRWSVSPEMAPNEATYLDLTYEKGDIVAIDGKAMTPAEVLTELNRLGGENGIGRLDIVENRFVGMKSRGAYETPGGTIMLRAHRAIESITLDREVAHLKDSPHAEVRRADLQRFLVEPRARDAPGRDRPQPGVRERRRAAEAVQGQRRRRRPQEPPTALFDEKIATFEDDRRHLRPGRRRGLHQAQRAAASEPRPQAAGLS